MEFQINNNMLILSRDSLSRRKKLYWIVGGSGSGKTTICKALSARFNIPIYNLDDHIYGAYHGRFEQDRHPVNRAWSTSKNGLAWLLDKSWDEFNSFNQAALPEYLDLLVEDMEGADFNDGLLIDGGVCNPALIAKVILSHQIVCLEVLGRSSVEIWEENEERIAMKKMIFNLPNPENAWYKFLEFDKQITQTIQKECKENSILICSRNATESVDEFTVKIAQTLGIY